VSRYGQLGQTACITVLFHFVELDWSHPSDVWSLGCVIFELYTGRTLFEVLKKGFWSFLQLWSRFSDLYYIGLHLNMYVSLCHLNFSDTRRFGTFSNHGTSFGTYSVEHHFKNKVCLVSFFVTESSLMSCIRFTTLSAISLSFDRADMIVYPYTSASSIPMLS
jgi:serine/threonine protein kinase